MRVPPFSPLLLLASACLAAPLLATVAMGCSRHEPATPAACAFARGPSVHDGHDPGVAGPMTAVADDTPSEAARRLVAEARRELSVMSSTSYRHETKVDEESGVFEFDCSGFVSYALRIAAPAALEIVPVGVKGRPRAEDYVAFFDGLASAKAPSPWVAVPHASELREGDVFAWLRPDDVDNTSTGHMGIVAASPAPCGGGDVTATIGGSSEWLVRIIDSTQTPHADDARKKDEVTGLGMGTIGLIVDAAGAPIGYRWKGGVSEKAHATKIVLARLR